MDIVGYYVTLRASAGFRRDMEVTALIGFAPFSLKYANADEVVDGKTYSSPKVKQFNKTKTRKKTKCVTEPSSILHLSQTGEIELYILLDLVSVIQSVYCKLNQPVSHIY